MTPASSAICPTCKHGAAIDETLNSDGSCPYRAIAIRENASTAMKAEIERVLRAPDHLRPGVRVGARL